MRKELMRGALTSMLLFGQESLPPPHVVPAQDMARPKGKIVYVSNEGGNDDLYLINSDGTDKKRLTNTPALERDPRFLSDGKRIVYASFEQGKNWPISKINILDIESGKKKEVLVSEAPDVVSCPAEDSDSDSESESVKDDIVFSREIGGQGLDIYGASLQEEKIDKIKQLTQDLEGTSEMCPVVSPDGEHIAFSVYEPGKFSRIRGAVIYERDKVEKTYSISKHPVFLSKARFYDFSPNGEKIAYAVEGEGLSFGHLYIANKDGTRAKLVSKLETLSASFSPDGHKIVVGDRGSDGKESIKVVNLATGETKKIAQGKAASWSPEIFPKVEISKNTIHIVYGLVSEIEKGKQRGGLAEGLLERLYEDDFGYDPRDIYNFSFGGWNSDFSPKDQSCEDTLRGPEEHTDLLGNYIESWQAKHPGQRMVLASHSYGAIPLLGALQKAKEGGFQINPRLLRVVITHAPAIGVDKPFIERVAAYWPVEMSEHCRAFFGATPRPSVINHPTGVALQELWDNRENRRKELALLSRWIRNNGGEIYSHGNYQDCIISFRSCKLPEDVLELFLFVKGWFPVVFSQEVPGSVFIGRFLGSNGLLGSGHETFWRTDYGMYILAEVVGRQVGVR